MRHSLFAFFCLVASLALAGCAVSIPLPSLLGEADDATASITGTEGRHPVSRQLDPQALDLHVQAGKEMPSPR